MGLFDFLFESDVASEPAPRVSPSQQELIDAISKWLLPQIGKGAEPYSGDLTAEIPKLFTEAYEKYAAGFEGDLGAATDTAIRDMISGKPAYEFDPDVTAERWEETYAGPVMEAWREHVLPGIKEGFNIPGVMYSRGKGRGVGRAAGEFYGQYVAPTLYSSLQAGEKMGFESTEAAAARRPAALGLPFQQFTQKAGAAGAFQQLLQQQLTAQYQEFLRTKAEPGWPVQTAAGYMTQPTLDWGMFREPSIIEQLAMLASGAQAMAASGGGG